MIYPAGTLCWTKKKDSGEAEKYGAPGVVVVVVVDGV